MWLVNQSPPGPPHFGLILTFSISRGAFAGIQSSPGLEYGFGSSGDGFISSYFYFGYSFEGSLGYSFDGSLGYSFDGYYFS